MLSVKTVKNVKFRQLLPSPKQAFRQSHWLVDIQKCRPDTGQSMERTTESESEDGPCTQVWASSA